MKYLSGTLLIMLTMASCATVDLSTRKEQKQDQIITKDKLTGMNGTFLNRSNDTRENQFYSLWATLNPDHDSIPNWDQAIVKLEVQNEKRIKATLLRNDSIIETKKIKFKVKKGFLDVRKYYKAGMIFGPLLWGLGSEDNCIGLTSENNLVIVNSRGGVAMLLIMPTFGAGHQTTTEYDRVSKDVTLATATQSKP